MENLKLFLRRKWYWILIYALCYSGLTTLVIYRFTLVPKLPVIVAFLPLILVPVFYFGALIWLRLKKKLNRKSAQRLTECTGVALLTTVVAILPAIILSLANIKAHIGQIFGDDLGLPSYMLALTLVVLFISGCIQATVSLLSYQPAFKAITDHQQTKK
jgi:hypothetical protein